MTSPGHVPLARTTRSGMVESVHCGSAVLVVGGSVAAAWGDVTAPVLPRSAAKPLQLHALMAAGLDLPDELLVLVAASHDGRAHHVEAVREILRRHGLDETALANTADWPLEQQRRRAIAPGRPRRSIDQNCSGKHAGMLATCTVNGWPLVGYLDVGHPVQAAIRSGMDELTSGAVTALAVDGCGAPTPAMSLTALAGGFAAIATAPEDSPGHRIARSIRAHPDLLGGEGRDITRLLDAVPGIVAKDGAEAVWAAALPDGRALAVKVGDGGDRAVPVIVGRLLGELDIASAALDAFADRPVLGHGRPVGRIEAAFFEK